ncbi:MULTISPECIES: prephenate dehydrogenase [Corynebacterium]|uniref:prephenate dehydrogenase n=1 Tax=Corynebacterium TaxID=1716 RepID=UPI001CE479A1|nr:MULTISPECIES: prephenate dehydrogenase [Corynebacterium]
MNVKNSPDAPSVCILGLGLIGGSLLRDLTAAGFNAYGWNRSESTVRAATADGYDVTGNLEDVLVRAREDNALLVLGVPMPALDSLLGAIAEHAPECGLTDVTSVKAPVLERVRAHGLEARFVGGHPMAGTADSGWKATMHGLFDGAVWVVAHDNAPIGSAGQAPSRANPWTKTWHAVVDMAHAAGAVVVPAHAKNHDRAVARISHLPHIVAETVAIGGDLGGPLALSLAASSFRDATRVAGTEPHLVRAMCENNREGLVEALDEAVELIRQAREDLASGGTVRGLTEDGFAARGRFEARAGRSKGDATNRPIFNVHPGKPRWISQLDAAEQAGAEITII